MQKLEKILKIENYKIIKVEDRNEKKKMIKIIYVESKNKKQKCPICEEYTKSIHDKLKPIELKYLKVVEQNTKINIVKKRFVCHKCNKKFTKELDINNKNKSISNKLEQKILKYLLNYNLSIKYIAKENNIPSDSVRRILLNDPIHKRALDVLDQRKKDTFFIKTYLLKLITLYIGLFLFYFFIHSYLKP